MTTYTICINEQQRAVIEAALAKVDDGGIPAYDDTPADEARVLHLLFKGLPADAAQCHPRTVHGFCL